MIMTIKINNEKALYERSTFHGDASDLLVGFKAVLVPASLPGPSP